MSDKKDLTRIEDLSEFIHQDDPDVDKAFDQDEEEDETASEDPEDLPGLDDLEEDTNSFSVPSEENGDDDDDEFDERTSLHDLEDDLTGPPPTSTLPIPEEDNEDELEQEEELIESTDEVTFDDADPFGDAPTSEEEETDTDDPFATESNWEQQEEDGDEEENLSFGEEDSPAFTEDDQDEESFSSFEDEQLDEPDEELPTPPPLEEPTYDPPPVAESRAPKGPVRFDDVKSFAENITYGKITAGGQPPYSVLIKNIRYEDDIEDIEILLQELGILADDNREAYKQALRNGALLISQLSEYSAIYLAHKLRRFDLDLLLGLSEEVHPSKAKGASDKGPIRKKQLRQNKSQNVSLSESPLTMESIILSTTAELSGHQVRRYLGVVTAHRIITQEDLDTLELSQDTDEANTLKDDLIGVYHDLSEELRGQAYKLQANGVTSMTFALSSLVGGDTQKYKVTCTGNAVWLEHLD